MWLNIFACTMVEPGMSGGNKIFIEFAKRWQTKGIKIRVFTSEEGKRICLKNGLSADQWKIYSFPYKPKTVTHFDVLIYYFWGLLFGIYSGVKTAIASDDIIYSSSDFFPDLIPAFICSIKQKKAKWIACFFLFASNPLTSNCKRFFTAFLFWLGQKPAYFLVKNFSDIVFVTSDPDFKKFPQKTIVIKGGVDLKAIANSKPGRKLYTAVFLGRLHEQKGVIELIDIWNLLVKKLPSAKLVIIGDGPLKKDIKLKIRNRRLEKNIFLFGFLEGAKKIKIIRQSRIIVHPAIYDSGGMSAMEGMACGLPGVSFDLPALKTYYPQGMIKVKCFDKKKFAGAVLKLHNDKKFYNRVSEFGLKLAKDWDWDKRAKQVWEEIGL